MVGWKREKGQSEEAETCCHAHRPWRPLPTSEEGHGGRELTDSYTLSVDGTEVAVLQQVHQEVLSGLLQRHQSLRRPSKGLRRHVVGDLAHLQRPARVGCPWCAATILHRAGQAGAQQGRVMQQEVLSLASSCVHQSREGQLPDQELCSSLVAANLAEGHGAGTVSVWLLCSRFQGFSLGLQTPD